MNNRCNVLKITCNKFHTFDVSWFGWTKISTAQNKHAEAGRTMHNPL